MSLRTTVAWVVLLFPSALVMAGVSDTGETWELAVERGEYAIARDLVEERLRGKPDDLTLKLARAQILAWSGELVEAAADYRQLIAIDAQDADYALGYAQVMAWMGSDDLALAELARAKTLAPEYEAVWQLESQILGRSPDRAAELESLKQHAAQRFPDSTWWSDTTTMPVQSAPVIRVDIGARADSLSTNAADWSSSYVRVSRRDDFRGDMYAAYRRDSRFGLEDGLVDVGGGWFLTERWTTGLDLSFGHAAQFSPQRDVALWVSRSWLGGWEAGARIRSSDYATNSVSSVTLNMARYIGNFRMGYSLIPTHLSGSSAAETHVATLDYYRSERSSLRLTVSAGEEVEAVAPGTLARTDVRGVALMLRHSIATRWELTWQAGSHRQGDLYRRRFIALSVSANL